jgi:hypothetical protein
MNFMLNLAYEKSTIWQSWASQFTRVCDLLCMVSNLYLILIIIYVRRGKGWGLAPALAQNLAIRPSHVTWAMCFGVYFGKPSVLIMGPFYIAIGCYT